uniref:Uncharacterized protein n=1 Tax=Romanomermis culicivorax TaxID=13658 RepID=A0A915KCE1_ROMCU
MIVKWPISIKKKPILIKRRSKLIKKGNNGDRRDLSIDVKIGKKDKFKEKSGAKVNEKITVEMPFRGLCRRHPVSISVCPGWSTGRNTSVALDVKLGGRLIY